MRTVGRCLREATGLRCGWPGSGVAVRFRGTRLSMRIREDGRNMYQISVDAQPPTAFRPDRGKEGVYTVAENLTPGVHDVSIVKRTDGDLGEGVFLGLDADGPFQEPPAPAARRLEFLGDSITSGYGVESSDPICATVSDWENEGESYASLVSRDLHADHHTISWSGRTVSEVHAAFELALPTRTDKTWDVKQWTPDAVIINLGTNNFGNGDPGEARFVAQYVSLVTRIREAYPKAFVLGVLGPMLTDGYPVGRNNLTHARRYLQVATTKLKSRDPNFDFIELDEQKHTDGLGCGFHPSKKTQRRMADRLTPRIKEKLGW